ncbi:MAG TPA: tRNA (pseudouridine(54)-N(1))-methyltransferase TrmY [Candidatus Bipolaricaulota bacterium]
MRAFIILGHRAPLTPQFTLNDLPGSAGRLDVLCRCVHGALFLSHDLRRDVEVFLVLQGQLTVRICGESVKRLNPDERSTAALIQKALEKIQRHEGADPVLSTPGITIARQGLSSLVDHMQARGFRLHVLHEGGTPFASTGLREPLAFVLSDHLDFSPADEQALAQLPRVSLGQRVYPASHCIVVVNHALDVLNGVAPPHC